MAQILYAQQIITILTLTDEHILHEICSHEWILTKQDILVKRKADLQFISEEEYSKIMIFFANCKCRNGVVFKLWCCVIRYWEQTVAITAEDVTCWYHMHKTQWSPCVITGAFRYAVYRFFRLLSYVIIIIK